METSILLTIGSTIIIISFGIIGFFLKALYSDLRKAVEDNGRNKGRIELVESKANSEISKLTETTQLEIKNLTQNVHELSRNVNTLVQALTKK